MSSLGLNSALYQHLRDVAELVDRSIVEQITQSQSHPASDRLRDMLELTASTRAKTPESLLLLAVTPDQASRSEIVALARALSRRHAPIPALESLAKRLEAAGDEIAARMLGR